MLLFPKHARELTMSSSSVFDSWAVGEAYETYMGRWSRQIAQDFMTWLSPERDADWID